MYALSKINCHILQHNDTPHIVMRDVQKCTPPCSSLRDRNVLPLCCIIYRTATDLGCGTGEMLKLIFQKDTHKELCGIDLSEEMLAVAKSKLPEQVKLLLGDSESLPFPDNTFDVVYCNDSFHHYPAPQNVLKEVLPLVSIIT